MFAFSLALQQFEKGSCRWRVAWAQTKQVPAPGDPTIKLLLAAKYGHAGNKKGMFSYSSSTWSLDTSKPHKNVQDNNRRPQPTLFWLSKLAFAYVREPWSGKYLHWVWPVSLALLNSFTSLPCPMSGSDESCDRAVSWLTVKSFCMSISILVDVLSLTLCIVIMLMTLLSLQTQLNVYSSS